MAKVGIIGGGYVGARLAEAVKGCHEETVVWDVDEGRRHHYFKDRHGVVREVKGDEEGMRHALGECEVYCVCTPTPEDDVNCEVTNAAIMWLAGEVVRHPCLIAIESSVYPGFTRQMAEFCNLGPLVHWVHAPERLWPAGEDAWPVWKINRVIGALDPQGKELAETFYERFTQYVCSWDAPEVTEWAKLLENTQRTVCIAYANWAKWMIEGRVGAAAKDVFDAMETKPFGYRPYEPGRAGGTCLPANAASLRFLELLAERPDGMPALMPTVRYWARQEGELP